MNQKLIDMIAELLNCSELNMDEMEPETCLSIVRAQTLLEEVTKQ